MCFAYILKLFWRSYKPHQFYEKRGEEASFIYKEPLQTPS